MTRTTRVFPITAALAAALLAAAPQAAAQGVVTDPNADVEVNYGAIRAAPGQPRVLPGAAQSSAPIRLLTPEELRAKRAERARRAAARRAAAETATPAAQPSGDAPQTAAATPAAPAQAPAQTPPAEPDSQTFTLPPISGAPAQPPAPKPAPAPARETQTPPPAAAAPAEPDPQPEMDPRRVAALSADNPADVGLAKKLEVGFAADGAELDLVGQGQLDVLASELARSNDRIQLEAFAGAAGDGSSEARRLSLRRALAVRAHLIQRGVESFRIDVRARGGASSGTPDRVDVFVQPS